MQHRFVKRNIIIFILLVTTTIAGAVIFARLVRNKKALEENLYTYIPVNVSSILQINDVKSIDRLISSEDRLVPVVKSLKSYFVFPVLFIEYDNSPYIIAKVTDEEVSLVEEKLQTDLFPYYQAKEVAYKETKLYLYATSENDFFVYMFYNGFIVGGYNINFFREIIDVDITTNAVIANSPMSRGLLDYMKRHYPANIFLNNSNCFSVFNIDFDTDKIELEGYDTRILDNNWICNKDEETVEIDYSMFPDSLDYYEADMYNPIVTDSFRCFFEPPSYSFKIFNQKENVYALKHTNDKLEIYNVLNDLEVEYTGKRFDTSDFYNGYRIYTTSLSLSEEVFNIKNRTYMVFYNDFLFFSESKEAVKAYLKQNGKYNSGNNIEKGIQNVISIYYSNNISKWYPEIFSSENPIASQSKKAYFMSFVENEKYKIKIFINN